MTTQARLILMRHAKARSEAGDDGDFARPLAERGLADARRMGEWLAARAPAIERFLCSPALRARQTAEHVLAQWPAATQPVPMWEPELYLAEPTEILAVIEREPAPTTLVLGHNPGLEELLLHLAPEAASRVPHASLMPTAAVYLIGLPPEDVALRAGCGRLLDHARPEAALD